MYESSLGMIARRRACTSQSRICFFENLVESFVGHFCTIRSLSPTLVIFRPECHFDHADTVYRQAEIEAAERNPLPVL